MDSEPIVILSGGTGTPKLLKGWTQKTSLPTEPLVIIPNTGDDWKFYGIHVSPDVDAVMYQLAGILDTAKMWGIKDDTFKVITGLKMLLEDVWFNLGDIDLGICLFRTHLLSQGYTLSEVTDIIRERLKIHYKIIPMSDDPVQTFFHTAKGTFHLQEYYIKHHAQFPIEKVEYRGAENAKLPSLLRQTVDQASFILIGPSNPVSSIAPILYPEMKKAISNSYCHKIVISPLIGSKVFSGPADKYLQAQGFTVSPIGINDFYYDTADTFVFHITDKNLALEKLYPEKKIFYKNILFNSAENVNNLVAWLEKTFLPPL